MKLINVGKKSNSYNGEVPKSNKEKIYYPDLRIEKKIPGLDMDEDVTLVVKATVSGMRSDEYGDAITFSIKQVGIKDTLTAKEKVDKVVDKMDLT